MAGIIAGIAAGTTIIGGLIGASSSKKRAAAAAREKRRLTAELDNLEKNRQAIVNPYSAVKSLAGMVTDLSGNVSNPYANLGVATQAAEMQIEQSDIALANTLDALQASGASAGGATALAQAALASKKGVAASIEAQEAANEKAKAEGRANLDQIKLGEARRVQETAFSEAGREQQAGVQGTAFVYGEKERRETEQLNRKQAQITGAAQAETDARNNAAAITGATISGVSSIGSAFAAAK